MTPEELQEALARITKEIETLQGMRKGLEDLRLQLEELGKKIPNA
jgi:hypothetical protein